VTALSTNPGPIVPELSFTYYSCRRNAATQEFGPRTGTDNNGGIETGNTDG